MSALDRTAFRELQARIAAEHGLTRPEVLLSQNRQPAVVRALWAARGQAAVVVPVTDHGPEPLLALYHRRCLPVVNAALAAGRLKLRAILEELPVVRVPAEALRQIDANLASFENINTPEDLARAVHQKR